MELSAVRASKNNVINNLKNKKKKVFFFFFLFLRDFKKFSPLAFWRLVACDRHPPTFNAYWCWCWNWRETGSSDRSIWSVTWYNRVINWWLMVVSAAPCLCWGHFFFNVNGILNPTFEPVVLHGFHYNSLIGYWQLLAAWS